MARVRQTRNKITWFGAVVFSLATFLAIAFKMEQVAITAMGGITFIIAGYQASQGYTKSKFLETNKPAQNEN